MHRAIFRLFVASMLVFACAKSAHAHDTYVVQQGPASSGPSYVQPYGVEPGYAYARERPRASIFRFGFRGMFTGALAGLGASYFVAHESNDKAEAVAISTGFGALGGAALGVSLGLFDRAGMDSAYYISRDMTYGVAFGAITGAIGGGLMAIGEADGEAVLYGMAGGSLVGLALGIVTGIIEGQVREPRDVPHRARRVSMSIGRLGSDNQGWGAKLGGRF